MKTYYRILIVCFLFPLITLAHNGKFKGKYSKEKTVSKEYHVAADADVNINNKYGNVSITTWNENRIVIDVTMKTNGDDEDEVIKRLDDIYIDFNGTENRVSAATNINKKDDSWSWIKKSSVSMEINYVVKMPKSNNLKLTNSYGAITMDDLDGTAKINAKYGQVYIDNLNATNNNIDLKYISTTEIKHLKSGTINSAYSDLTVDSAEDLSLFADYTKTRLGTINSLKYTNRYGKLHIENVKNITGNASYNGAMIDTISGEANFDLRYSGLTVAQFSPTAKDVSIDGRYSRISLGIHPEYAFTFDAEVSYGGFKGSDLLTLNPQEENKGNRKYYDGYYGSPDSENNISISSSYGTISFKKD